MDKQEYEYPTDKLTGWHKDGNRLTLGEYNRLAMRASRDNMTTYTYLKTEGYENARVEKQMSKGMNKANE